MTTADGPVRQGSYYLPVVFSAVASWFAGKAGLLELDYAEHTGRRSVRRLQPTSFSLPKFHIYKRELTRNACQFLQPPNINHKFNES